ncbi:MAG: hypothetical protein KDJ48_10135, partial [Nitratireductor sp.]|nr:hypothetical protein [Nitratireductor sp.]
RRIVEDHFATGDEGGLKQEPSLFDTFGTAPDPASSTDLALLDDDFDGGTTSIDALERSKPRQRDANRAVQRAHAINNDGHKPDLLPEF